MFRRVALTYILLDGLYTKITGGQRVDLFGAQKADLPAIWKEFVDAGFESGHAYGKYTRKRFDLVLGVNCLVFLGKALRTVKSCVGTSWCRYGIGDSVGSAASSTVMKIWLSNTTNGTS